MAYRSDFEYPRVLDLDTSLLVLRSGSMFSWVVDGTNMTILPGSSTIRFIQPTGMENKTGSNLNYHKVEFTSVTGSTLLRSSQIECNFNHVIIHNDGRIFGRNTFDSLTFFPDNTYQLDASLPQTIGNYWWVRGNNCFPIRLESTAYGDQAEVIKNSGIVTGDFIHMRDILASGGASFFAGANSSNIKNNAGWAFNNAPSYVYGFPLDTFLVKGTPLILNTLNFNIGPGSTYVCGDGSTGSTLSVSTPGTYYVTVTYDTNCSVSDSIIVFCRLGLDLNPTPTTCNAYADGAIELGVQGGPSLYTYLWSTGDTTQDVSSLKAGWYSVTVTDSVCYGVDSVEVTEPPVPAAHIPDTSFCEDTLITIQARPGFLHYEWYNGATTPSITLDHGDSIWLVVTDSNGCVSVKFHALVKEDPLPEPFLGSDTCVTYDEGLWLEPGIFEGYLWQDGTTSSSLEARWEGTYWVQVKSATCLATDTVYISSCPARMNVPNVFTPNGDGINDVFIPEARNIVLYRLMVFNRWGGLVFQTNNVRQGWDGQCEGGNCSEGTYFFTIDYSEFLQEDKNNTLQGSVTLLR
ncbi:MAG: gliding motility-associated C-terminal domain-containing protein [Bacteroidales bacterium]|nr:gliding motility-associated C-terminal domain-containing protein [Bacteroidales bacterium]